MDIFLEKEIKNIKVVDDKKRYWFIRTYGGEAYTDYYKGDYVGLGLNNVPYKYIIEANPDDLPTFTRLQSFIEENTDYKKGEATKWANQLVAFNHEVNIGDTVIIPSKNSTYLAIGTVTSDVYVVKDPKHIQTRNGIEQLPEKRRKIKWEKEICKDDLQGDLRGLLASHQGITNADDYSITVEGLIDSVFIKEEFTYLVIQIKQDEDINAFDFKNFLDGLTYFYNEFCVDNGFPQNKELSIKIKVQSKGKTVLKGLVIAGLIGLAGLLILANNSEVEIDVNKGTVKGKSDGLLKSLTDFLDRTQERKKEWAKFQDSLERLKADRSKYESPHSNKRTDEPKKDGKQG